MVRKKTGLKNLHVKFSNSKDAITSNMNINGTTINHFCAYLMVNTKNLHAATNERKA